MRCHGQLGMLVQHRCSYNCLTQTVECAILYIVKKSRKVETRQTQVPPVPVASPVVYTTVQTPMIAPMTVVEAAGIAAVRRCVTLIANGIAGSPWTQWADDERVPIIR